MSSPLQPDNIPQELKLVPQWVCWRWGVKGEGGEKTKLPVNPNGTGLASTTNPATWSSFDKCLGLTRAGFADGIGFVFTKECGYVGVDLDECYNGEELAYPEVAWVNRLGSYTEVSPSGTGVKVIFKGTLPEEVRRHSWGGNGIYDSGRFFTVTGNVYKFHFVNVVTPETLQPLLDEWFPPQEEKGGGYEEEEERLTDNEVLVCLNREQDSQKAIGLYNGRWRETGYDSQSEADLALVSKLAFYTGPCPAQIDRIFRQSGLMRDKWDETRGGGLTYGERTIEYALEGKAEYYQGRGHDLVPLPLATPEEKQVEKTVKTPEAKHKWQQDMAAYPTFRPQDRPDMLHSLVEYLAPLGAKLGEDWLDIMSLGFVSSLFPDARFENLPLNLWTLGVSSQGVGKSVLGDELDRLAHKVAHHHGQSLLRYSSGTSAGLVRRLDGTGRSVLAYFSEWTGFAKSITQDYNDGMKETLLNLYDGRDVYHQLATGTVSCVKPYLVLNGMTTKVSFCAAADANDGGNGFYSRLMFVASNPLRGIKFAHRTEYEQDMLAQELSQHLEQLPDFKAITFDSREAPVALEEYLASLGVVEDGGYIDLDELPTHGGQEESPAGRLHARVKKVSALLELMEARPKVRHGVLLVSEENVSRAVRLVQRGNAYSRRVLGWLSRSKDEEYMGRVHKALKQGSLSLAGLLAETHLSRQQVEGALELLEGEGLVVGSVESGRRVYSRR